MTGSPYSKKSRACKVQITQSCDIVDDAKTDPQVAIFDLRMNVYLDFHCKAPKSCGVKGYHECR